MKEIFADKRSRRAFKDRMADRLLVLAPLMVYAVIYVKWFNYLEARRSLHYTVIHTVIDDMIPFAEIFVIPYFAWFIYVSYTILYFLLRYDIEEYMRLSVFLCTGMTVFLVVSTFWPNMQDLRPVVMPRDNIFCDIVARLYMTDTPTNIWPSIHVYNSIGAHIAIARSNRFGRGFKRASFVISALIIMSTMFIKQHSVFDVIGAFLMAVIVYVFAYRSEFMEVLTKTRRAFAVTYNREA